MDNTIPNPVKIARDIDLVNQHPVTVCFIVETHQMNEQNYTSLIPFTSKGFENDVTLYYCDICKSRSLVSNPIWTNNEHQGVDICTTCMNTAFEKISPLSGWNPGPVYSLMAIVNAIN